MNAVNLWQWPFRSVRVRSVCDRRGREFLILEHRKWWREWELSGVYDTKNQRDLTSLRMQLIFLEGPSQELRDRLDQEYPISTNETEEENC